MLLYISVLIAAEANFSPFQTAFDQGTASLTLNRLIWADYGDPVSEIATF